MRSELELLRAVVDAVPSMLAYWDSELRCRFANRAYEAWFGIGPEALHGKHIRELLGPLYELNLPHIQAALRKRQPLDRRRPVLLSAALRTRRAVLLERPTPAEIDVFGQSEEHRRLLRAADISSLIAVPLVAHDELLGGIVLVSSSNSRSYGPSDLHVAEELARRAALALANARLYEAARHATAVRDEVLSLVAHDLRNPLHAVVLNAERCAGCPSASSSLPIRAPRG